MRGSPLLATSDLLALALLFGGIAVVWYLMGLAAEGGAEENQDEEERYDEKRGGQPSGADEGTDPARREENEVLEAEDPVTSEAPDSVPSGDPAEGAVEAGGSAERPSSETESEASADAAEDLVEDGPSVETHGPGDPEDMLDPSASEARDGDGEGDQEGRGGEVDAREPLEGPENREQPSRGDRTDDTQSTVGGESGTGTSSREGEEGGEDAVTPDVTEEDRRVLDEAAEQEEELSEDLSLEEELEELNLDDQPIGSGDVKGGEDAAGEGSDENPEPRGDDR